jgi:hypothetical protein
MRSPNREHERTSFFKYVPASTADKILANCSLRWSSPVLFNDPLDVPREIFSGLKLAKIVEALLRRISFLIEKPPDNISDLAPQLRPLIERIKNGVPPAVRGKLIADLRHTAVNEATTSAGMDGFAEWWRTSIPNQRILCLAESPSHSAMWYHYADKYRGAALEFLCSDEHDSAWLCAEPVSYPEAKPLTYTADGWAELLTLGMEAAVQKMNHLAMYTKAPDWSYEKEWRIATPKRPGDTGLFTDYKFHPEELASVFLGPLISAEDKATLLAAATKYPRVRVHEVSIGLSRELVFNEIRR